LKEGKLKGGGKWRKWKEINERMKKDVGRSWKPGE
jgi:hypothetical protein